MILEAQSAVATYWLTLLLVLFRVSAVVALLPAFGEVSVPARVKLAVSIAFGLIIFPSLEGPLAPAAPPSSKFIKLVIIEVLNGLALGMLLRLFVVCLNVCGSIAAQSTSLSQIASAAGADPMPAIAQVLTMGGLALAMLMGLPVAATSYLIASYEWLPLGNLVAAGVFSQLFVSQVASAFQLAFAMAAPFFILALLYNVTLGVINRAMPQLMVAFVGAPVITAGALAMLAVTAVLILTRWQGVLFDMMLFPRGL